VNEIKCPKCGTAIDIDDILAKDIEARVVAESILAWSSDEGNIELLSKLQQLGVAPTHQDLSAGKLAGQSFVVVGTLQTMIHDQASERVRALGGTLKRRRQINHLPSSRWQTRQFQTHRRHQIRHQNISEAEFLEIVK
jgi:BRCT domain type II-containing protein